MSQSIENKAENIQIDPNESVIASEQCDEKSEAVTDENIAQNESIEPTDSTDNILVRLNDDCIIQAFEYLPLCDLCNVADVCRVFKSNALSVFKRRHTGLLDLDALLDATDSEDESDSVVGSDSEGEMFEKENKVAWNNKHKIYEPVEPEYARHLSSLTVEKLFRHFGAYIQTFYLGIGNVDHKFKILELLTTFCTHEDAKLNKLIIKDVTIKPDLIPRIQPLFDSLKFLDITGGSFYSFYIGAELTELILEDVYLPGIFTQKLEKLHTVSFIDVEGSCTGIFKSFLQMATQLKRLTITGCTTNWDSDILWYSTLYNLPSELEEFELDVQDEIDEVDFYYLGRLQHLKAFTLNCMGNSHVELLNDFVEHNVPIEELSLENFTLTVKAATSLAGLSKMKKLSLTDGGWESSVHLPNVIKGMPVLEKLYLSSFGDVTIDVIKATIRSAPKLNVFVVNFDEKDEKFIVRTDDYHDICRLVQKRLDVTKLTLELRGKEIKFHVPKDIVEMNRLWLEVVIITFDDVKPVDIIDFYGMR